MGLRLDTPEGFAGDRGFGGRIVIPGNATDSLLFQRITAEAENFRMPRDREALTADEVETISCGLIEELTGRAIGLYPAGKTYSS